MRGLKLILTVASLLTIAICAHATVMVHLDLDELSRRSDVVVVGTVTDTRTVMINGYPWTLVTVSVQDSLLKKTTGSLQVQVPGGVQQVNGKLLVTRVDGAPVFTRLEKAVFFLRSGAPQNFQIVGWNQGLWRVRNSGGKEIAVSSDESTAPSQFSLEEMKKRVERAAQARQQ